MAHHPLDASPISHEDIHYIIVNADKIKNDCLCETCKGTGYQNWNENGEDIKPGKLTEWVEDRMDGNCEVCLGVGYVDIYRFNEDA